MLSSTSVIANLPRELFFYKKSINRSEDDIMDLALKILLRLLLKLLKLLLSRSFRRGEKVGRIMELLKAEDVIA